MPNSLNPEFKTFVQNEWTPYIRQAKTSWYVDERIASQHILPNLGKFKLLDISAERIKFWYLSLLTKGLAVTTCNRILYVLKNIFNFAAARGLFGKNANPMAQVRWIKTERKSVKAILPRDVDAIFSTLKKENGRVEAKIILLLIYTGAGKNEILRAKWENYFPEKNLLLGERMGGKRLREIWLPVEAANILSEQKRVAGSPWIFPGRDKMRPLSDIFLYWNEVRNSIGLKYLKINEFRENWLKNQLIEGIDVNRRLQLSANRGRSHDFENMRFAIG